MPQIPVGIRDRKKSVMHLFPQGMPNNVEKRETCKPTLQSNVKCCEQGTHRAPKSTSQDHLDLWVRGGIPVSYTGIEF